MNTNICTPEQYAAIENMVKDINLPCPDNDWKCWIVIDVPKEKDDGR